MGSQATNSTYTAHLPSVTHRATRHWARVALHVLWYCLVVYLVLGGRFPQASSPEPILTTGPPPLIPILIVLTLAAIFVLALVWTIAGHAYQLSYRTLRVAAGPTLLLDDIHSVACGNRPLWCNDASLAWTGLIIDRRDSRAPVFVSPRNRTDFLRDLADRCPHLILSEGALSPADEGGRRGA
jgi:hypothetical protein